LYVAFKGAHFQDVPTLAIARPYSAHVQLRGVVVHVNIVRMSAAIAVKRKDGVFNGQIALTSGPGGIEEALHVVVNI